MSTPFASLPFPTLEAILRVSRAAGFHVRDVLMGDIEAVRPTEGPQIAPFVSVSRETHHVLDEGEMELLLGAAVAADPLPTLASIYADTRANERHVRRHRPRFRCRPMRKSLLLCCQPRWRRLARRRWQFKTRKEPRPGCSRAFRYPPPVRQPTPLRGRGLRSAANRRPRSGCHRLAALRHPPRRSANRGQGQAEQRTRESAI
jgi:hypothetical protein